MNEQVSGKLGQLFKQQYGIARTSEIAALGITPYMIRKLVDEGDLIRIKQGLYRKVDYLLKHGQDEFIEASKLVSKGVVCLLSALSYYELTTYSPWEHYIAIPRVQRSLNCLTTLRLKLFISLKHNIRQELLK